jgi:hypothetical protein
MLESICFTLVVIAMALPGLILLPWPQAASDAETAAHGATYRPREI